MQGARGIFEKHCAGVDEALKMRACYVAIIRVAIHEHEQRRAVGEEDVRDVVLHRQPRLSALVRACIACLQLLERRGEAVRRDARLQRRLDAGGCVRTRWHVDLVEHNVAQLHGRRCLIDFGPRNKVSHTVVRRRVLGAHCNCRTAFQVIAVPYFNLWLKNLYVLLRRIEVARPDGG